MAEYFFMPNGCGRVWVGVGGEETGRGGGTQSD